MGFGMPERCDGGIGINGCFCEVWVWAILGFGYAAEVPIAGGKCRQFGEKGFWRAEVVGGVGKAEIEVGAVGKVLVDVGGVCAMRAARAVRSRFSARAARIACLLSCIVGRLSCLFSALTSLKSTWKGK